MMSSLPRGHKIKHIDLEEEGLAMSSPKKDSVIRIPGQLRIEIEEIIESIVRRHLNEEEIPSEIMDEMTRKDCSRCSKNMIHKKRARTRRECENCGHLQFLLVSGSDSTELARNLSVVSVMALGIKLVADSLDIHKRKVNKEF